VFTGDEELQVVGNGAEAETQRCMREDGEEREREEKGQIR
jgi:hypothetical protein